MFLFCFPRMFLAFISFCFVCFNSSEPIARANERNQPFSNWYSWRNEIQFIVYMYIYFKKTNTSGFVFFLFCFVKIIYAQTLLSLKNIRKKDILGTRASAFHEFRFDEPERVCFRNNIHNKSVSFFRVLLLSDTVTGYNGTILLQ